MLWRVALAVAALCVAGICSGVKADVMGRLVVPRDYGVKLCGREFIRAVIFTCGGSRWRRDLEPFALASLTDDAADDDQHNWQRGAELADDHVSLRSTVSLSDLLAFYVDDRQQQQSLTGPAPLDKKWPPVLGNQEGRRGLIPSKKKRNFSLGVAGMCCSQGCTKHDIGRLC
ncbi:prorelaxin H1 [Betta splendens]|uniref:Prorelaxin H1 n=1 Tax=Betta splendens TaxID=158456 RepID=A0A6P7NY57_BETSP|nr:prorelaxin H1 [Betta splendens]